MKAKCDTVKPDDKGDYAVGALTPAEPGTGTAVAYVGALPAGGLV